MRVLYNQRRNFVFAMFFSYFLLSAMSCTQNFLMQELYKRETFFSSDDFVVWNWLNKSIVNIIRIAIEIVLNSLNMRFTFVIFTLFNIFFLFSLQLKQKSSTCLIVMCLWSHWQYVVKTFNIRCSCNNWLNFI